jgi:hypothetical protein
MGRYIAKRLGLAVITLVLLSMIIFAAAQLLPGDLGRSVLGRDASAEAVAEYNHEHGTDRPAVVSTSTGPAESCVVTSAARSSLPSSLCWTSFDRRS